MGRLGFQPSGRAAELADEAYAVCLLDALAHGHRRDDRVHPV